MSGMTHAGGAGLWELAKTVRSERPGAGQPGIDGPGGARPYPAPGEWCSRGGLPGRGAAGRTGETIVTIRCHPDFTVSWAQPVAPAPSVAAAVMTTDRAVGWMVARK